MIQTVQPTQRVGIKGHKVKQIVLSIIAICIILKKIQQYKHFDSQITCTTIWSIVLDGKIWSIGHRMSLSGLQF